MGLLDNKVIVVTGAHGVLGAAVATAAEAAGAKVARIDFAQRHEGGELVFEGVDLADEAATQAVMDQIAASAGGIDGLVNIAGGFVFQTLADAPAAVWDKMFRLNLVTAVSACRAAMGHMNGGSIVNIGANAASRAGAGMGAYAASKSGVARLTEALSEELAGAKVRVNAILPSILDTPTNRADMPKADFGSWVAPQDLAKVVLFLLSDDGAAITGASIPVTRGSGV
jgi:NAD(P)-dependent dehydrogenase (short-subunit alcohol dehydrogenase family)